MSSVTSSFAQIAGRTKFFLATADVSGYVVPDLHSTLATSVDQTLLNADTKVGVPRNTLLKDLGRQIVLYDDEVTAGSPHLATFRQVQVVNGSTTEGVDGGAPEDFPGSTVPSYYNTFYVCVSSVDQTANPVRVVRTG